MPEKDVVLDPGVGSVAGFEELGVGAGCVHVRRLRAKLGPEHEQLIGTVRNVGYKFVRPVRSMSSQREPSRSSQPTRTAPTQIGPTADPNGAPAAYQQAVDSGHTDVAPTAATYLTALSKQQA